MNDQTAAPRHSRTWIRWVCGFFAISALFRLAGPLISEFNSEGISNSKARSDASVAIAHGKAASRTIESYFQEHKEYPLNLTVAGFNAPLPEPVESIRVNSETGILKLVLMGRGPSITRTIFLEPTIDTQGNFAWHCKLGDVPPGRQPAECQSSR